LLRTARFVHAQAFTQCPVRTAQIGQVPNRASSRAPVKFDAPITRTLPTLITF
jgi:hypothetical protein